MKVKVFEKNANGKIEFTRKELEALLNEVFQDGYDEGKNKTWTWTSPTLTTPSITYRDITCDSTAGRSNLKYVTTTASTSDACINGGIYNQFDNADSVYYGITDEDQVPGQLSLEL